MFLCVNFVLFFLFLVGVFCFFMFDHAFMCVCVCAHVSVLVLVFSVYVISMLFYLLRLSFIQLVLREHQFGVNALTSLFHIA